MKKPRYQYFTLEEYQQRLDSLRTRMQEKGVDAMMVTTPENLYYLSGYQTPGYYWFQTLIVLLDREPVFIARLVESTNVVGLSWVEDSRPYGDSDDWIAHTKDALVSLGLANKKIGIEKQSWFITIRDYEGLSAVLPDVEFVDCYGLVEEGRIIKSPQELEYIKQAGLAAEAGTRAAIEASKPGVDENEIAAAVHTAQINAGSEYTGLPIFVTTGDRSDLCHATWYRGKVNANQMVYTEIPGCINRYHAATMRNIYVGDPPKKMIKATQVMADALDETIKFIKPGVTAHDAHMFCKKMVDDAGLGAPFNHRAAYSIGIGFAPDWGEGHIISMKEGEHRELQAGMTFHLIPFLHLPGLTTIGVSETIHITENGCESLTPNLERKLFVK